MLTILRSIAHLRILSSDSRISSNRQIKRTRPVCLTLRYPHKISRADLPHLPDGVADAIIWSVIEGETGIAAACIITLPPLVRKLNIMCFLNSSNSRSNTGFSNNSRPIHLSEWPRNSKSTVDASIEHRGTRCGSEEEILGTERMRKSKSEAAGDWRLFEPATEPI